MEKRKYKNKEKLCNELLSLMNLDTQNFTFQEILKLTSFVASFIIIVG